MFLDQDAEHPIGRRRLAMIFALAFVLRLAFLVIMTDQIDVEQMTGIDRDAYNYYEAARMIHEDFDFHSYGVLMFGPGYPGWLAMSGWLVSLHPVALLVLQILLSAMGSVLMALVASRLSGDARIGVVCGLINATSMESITLANILFSESLFFILMLLGLLALLSGLARNRWPYFVLSGVLFGLAALTRSIGQYMFGILLLVSLVALWRTKQSDGRNIIRKMKWPAVAALVMIIMVGAWIGRNHHHYGISHLTLAGPGGMAHMARLVVSKRDSISFDDAYAQFVRDVKTRQTGEPDDDLDITDYRPYLPQPKVTDAETIQYNQAFVAHAKETLRQMVRQQPWLTLSIYLENVRHNILTDWGKQYYYLPEWNDSLRAITSWTDKKGLNYRVSLLALIGAVMLFRRRRFRLLIVLIAVYVYFALLSGFSVNQGSRVFYPAQIAWAVLVAYPLLWLYERAANRWRRRSLSHGRQTVDIRPGLDNFDR